MNSGGGGGWNQGGPRDMPNGIGQGQGNGGNPLNMGALTMPMLAALSQAGWGLLGNLQQQQNQDPGPGGFNQGGHQPPQGGHHGNGPPNQGPGGWGSNSWGDGNQGNWGPPNRPGDKYNR